MHFSLMIPNDIGSMNSRAKQVRRNRQSDGALLMDNFLWENMQSTQEYKIYT